jgi:hypothetical protein
VWKGDRINEFRKNKLTSLQRFERGTHLLSTWDKSKPIEKELLRFLRDKGRYSLGHRSAIDALIATHSVIYDAKKGHLYVSKGPALSGAFLGFDLNASFRKRAPKRVGELPADLRVPPSLFSRVKESFRLSSLAKGKLRIHKCGEAKILLDMAYENYPEGAHLLLPYGNYFECVGDRTRARDNWQKALALSPPYYSEKVYLERKLR